ncbi:MAG: hypothetical protein M3466_00910 [Gemmatimonadota bacterium]|nr:hypothetical protein [Gemmatimonadota bacterium]
MSVGVNEAWNNDATPTVDPLRAGHCSIQIIDRSNSNNTLAFHRDSDIVQDAGITHLNAAPTSWRTSARDHL